MSKKSPIEGVLARIQRHPEVPEHQRVRRIVDLIMSLAQLKPGMENGPLEIAEDELDCILSAYQWDAATLFKNGRLRIGFQPRMNPLPSAWERDAVLALMEANPYYIRRCTGKSGMCKGLFYATRIDNTTCSRACISARYDGDPVKYEARLKTQRANHKTVKDQQDSAAKGALGAGHVIAKRVRTDHRTTTDSESWLVGAGNLQFKDKKAAGVVWKAVSRALGENRKRVLTVVPDVGFIASGELAGKSNDKT
jgi:hypothetical protein